MGKPKMTKFAAYLPDAIYGLGDNPDAAIENACEFINTEDAEEFRNNCKTAPMTDALIATVESKGGNTDFGLLQNGTLGTYDEVKAE